MNAVIPSRKNDKINAYSQFECGTWNIILSNQYQITKPDMPIRVPAQAQDFPSHIPVVINRAVINQKPPLNAIYNGEPLYSANAFLKKIASINRRPFQNEIHSAEKANNFTPTGRILLILILLSLIQIIMEKLSDIRSLFYRFLKTQKPSRHLLINDYRIRHI